MALTNWRVAWLLLGLVLAAYWPALRGLFIWDDVTFISTNSQIHSPSGLWKIWFSKESTDYWPLTYTVFWLLWRVFGEHTLGYHLINICVHAGNAFLVWRILSRLNPRWALAVAMLFAVHPVNVESVAWIFQLKTTLSSGLALATLLCWMRFYEGERRAYWPALGLFILALLTKASVVTWPLVMIGFVSVKNRRLAWRDFQLILPFFLVSVAAGSLGVFWYSYDQLVGGERVRVESFVERLAGAGYSFWFYLYKGIFPAKLIFIYPRWELSPLRALDFLPVTVAVFVMGLLATLRRPVLLLAALGFFLSTIFPVLGFVDIYYMRFSYVADHWQYLSLLGTLGLLVFALAPVLEKRGVSYLLFAPVPLLFFLTFQQSALYANEETIWRDTLEKNHGAWLALNSLGVILMGQGKGDEAVPYFQNCLRMKEDYVDPYLNMGVYQLSRSEDGLAGQYFTEALRVFPDNARVLNNLASLALRRGEPQTAIQYLRSAVEHLPTYAMGWKNLGIIYRQLGREADAMAAFRKAAELTPDDPEIKNAVSQLRINKNIESFQ